MKNVRLIVFFTCLSLIAQGQNFMIPLDHSGNKPAKVVHSGKKVTFNFSIPGIDMVEVNTPEGVYNQMVVPGSYRSGKVGEPQKVTIQKLLSVPVNENVSVKSVSYTTQDIKVGDYYVDNKLIPYQPSESKNKNIQDVKWQKNKQAYAKNSFDQSELASVKVLGTMRDKRLVKLIINPVRYNPVSNTIRFYNDIQVDLTITSAKGANNSNTKASSPFFNSLPSIQPLATSTSKSYAGYPDLAGFPVKYLLVAPHNYLNTLNDFIHWKTQKGFQVVVGDLSVIGNTPVQIKTWVRNQYNNPDPGTPAPSFLLLVGDIQQVPASQNGIQTGRITDLYYASVDGDMFPEMYYGRLPAQDTIQLKGMLSKILTYEKYQFPDDSYLNDVTLIAGADATWNPRVGQPTVNYGTQYYFNATNGFNNVNAYLSSYSGCYTVDKASVSLINYTAHCSQTSWANPYLGASTVDALQNTGKYPVAVGNCCTSGDFSIDECIGEAWIRNPNGGAIAYLGSVPDTYWWEDYYWAVGAHDPVYNQYPSVDSSSMGIYDVTFDSTYQTVDAMVFVGNLAVTEAHNEGYDGDISSQYYWEAYHCLGDPSLMPYFTVGKDNHVVHDTAFHFGVNNFTVKAAPGSMVALSNRNGLIGVNLADADSVAIIATDTLTLVDSVTLVVTKARYKPYITTLPVGDVEGTFLTVDNVSVNDAAGNNNGQLDFSENAGLNLTLKNIGNQTAQNIYVSVTSTDDYLGSFSQNIKIPASNLGADATQNITDNFLFGITDSVPDGHTVTFNVALSDSAPSLPREFYSNIYQNIINAPVLNVVNWYAIDDFSGNGNGTLDYGETALLKVAFINTGHAQVSATVNLANISVQNTIQINTPDTSVGIVTVGDTLYADFEVTIPYNASVKQKDTLLVTLNGGFYSAQKQIVVTIGQSLFEQLGTGNLIVADYPFNNYYLNNSCQLMYLANEFGSGSKAVKSIGFNINQFTADSAYRDLSNFKIKALFTTKNVLNEAIDMSTAQELYSVGTYYLPDSTGWSKIVLQNPLIFSNDSNLVIQITWGTMNNYAPSTDRTLVYGTATGFNSVIWGAQDDVYPAPLASVSKNRPDTQFGFDSVGIINISVLGDLPVAGTDLSAGCSVTIGNTTKTTDNQGRVQFYFLEFTGDYAINFHAFGYCDTTLTFHKTQTTEHVEMVMKRHPELKLIVRNSRNNPVENAKVIIGGYDYYTDFNGEIIDYSSIKDTYTGYTITSPGYATIVDSVLMNNSDISRVVNLVDHFDDIVVKVLNSRDEPVQGIEVTLGINTGVTNDTGAVVLPGITPGSYLIQVFNPGYISIVDSVVINYSNNPFVYHLTTIGLVSLTMKNGVEPVVGVDASVGGNIYTSDTTGEIITAPMVEGVYPVTVSDVNWYPYADSVHVFGANTLKNIPMVKKADIQLYVYNGVTGLSGVQVLFGSNPYVTDSAGFVTIDNILQGSYSCSVDTTGFLSYYNAFLIGHSDTLLNIRLNPASDLEFHIRVSGEESQPVTVCLGADTIMSDSSGYVRFNDLNHGFYHYSVNLPGYYQISDTVTIANNNVSLDLTLLPIPDVKFLIRCADQPVDSALITFNNRLWMTNNFGEVIITDISKGNYSYMVEKPGYLPSSGTLAIHENDTMVYIELLHLPSVNFIVKCNAMGISEAKVSIGDTVGYTNDSGLFRLIDLLSGHYQYSVEKQGYYTLSDSLDVDSLDLVDYIQLQPVTYKVQFHVTHLGLNEDSVLVSFNTDNQYTDSSGVTIFKKVFPGSYSFTLSKQGLKDYLADIAVVNSDLLINIDMETSTFNVEFLVSDDSGALEGANVTFDSKVKSTDSGGKAVFSNVAAGPQLPYTVRKVDTHYSQTGSVDLSSDTTINVVLIVLSVSDQGVKLILYPNPAENKIYVETEQLLIGSEYSILDNKGTTLGKGKINKLPQEIELHNLAQGVYYIRINSHNSTFTRSFVVKQ